MRVRRALPLIFATLAAALAIYELVAVATDWVPTITETLEAAPGWVELAVIGGAMVWLSWHFGFLTPGRRPPFGSADQLSVDEYNEELGRLATLLARGEPGTEGMPSSSALRLARHLMDNGVRAP